MRRTRGCLVSVLLMLPVLFACQPTPAPVPTQHPYVHCLKEMAPKTWQEVDPREVTVDREWIVFYRDGDPSENPIDAVMYRLSLEECPTSSDETPSFVAYDLRSPYDGHMCECKCDAGRDELFSTYGGSELVIQDECEKKLTRLLGYRWVTETLKYELVTYFDGDRISWEPDRVTVDDYTLGGADLSFRCTYSPLEDVPLFTEKDSYSKGECVFTDGLPDDVLTSPYPEMIVLALYSQIQYTDTTKIQGYFADGAWELVDQWEGQCGCPAADSPITHVRVINMDITESRQVMRPVDQYCPPNRAIETAENRAIVTTEAVCEYGDGSEEPISVTWLLTWEGGGWRLMTPTPLEEAEETSP